MGKKIFLVVLLFLFSPLVFASTNNIFSSYSFDNDFSDNTGNYDLHTSILTPFPTINSVLFILGNGSLNFSNALTGDRGLSGSSEQAGISSAGLNVTMPSAQSVSVWLNASGTGGSGGTYPILAYGSFNGAANVFWQLQLATNRSLQLLLRNGSAQMQWIANAPPIPLNQWTFVGIVYTDGVPPKFFINGTFYAGLNQTPINYSFTPTGRSLPMKVGNTYNYQDVFSGNIDELAIWHKALTNADMSALYNAGAGAVFPFSEASDQNFSVNYNSTEDMSVTTKITLQENTSDFNYKYALSCDITVETLWNELFNNFYNFSTRNVTTSFSSPQSYLTFSGLQWDNVVNVTPNFDLVKNGNVAYRDFLNLQVQYQTLQNNLAELIAYDNNNNPVVYLVLNKTSNLLVVSQFNPSFSTMANIANFTLVGGNVNLALQFVPHHDSGTNTDDFVFTLTESNNTGAQTQPNYETMPAAATIQNVELFSGNNFNGTTYYKRLSLYKTGDPFPDFTEFQNGEREVISGVIFETPAPYAEINGDGFSIITDFNNVFYSVCDYTTVGNKVQRHFIAPTGAIDNWENYRDLVILSTQVQTNTSTTSENGNAGAGSGDIGTDLIPAAVTALGFKSTASKLLFWTVLVLLISVIIGFLSPFFGMLIFIVGMILGVPLGLVSIFVLLVFLIFAALITALVFKYVFAK